MCVAVAQLKKIAPQNWIELQEKRFDINNLPCVGHDSNHGFFSQLQVNLAGAEAHDSSRGLDANLGRAGKSHYDGHDCPQGYTAMFSMSNFGKHVIHPGMFHFLELGLYINMVNFQIVFFSGLHFHGGSPPRAAPGHEVPDDATRVVNVLYPNDPLLNGTLPVVLALSGGARVELIPSARYDLETEANLRRGALNFMRDGDSLMSRKSYIQYVTRQCAILVETLVSQSPHVDVNLSALKDLFVDRADGQVIDYWKTWKYPPGMSTELKDEMRSISREVEERKLDVCLSVPTQVRRLYLDNKLKLVKGADGHKGLQLQFDKLFDAKKKRKGTF